MDFGPLQTIKRPVLSRDKQMCCGVLQYNRRVDQALSFKNTVFYLYLFTSENLRVNKLRVSPVMNPHKDYET